MSAKLRSPGFLKGTLSIFLLGLLSAWVSDQFSGISGWAGFLAVFALAAGGILIVLRLLADEALPAWLPGLTTAAALLRLLAGVIWFTMLPAFGYETDVQAAGYVMEDAFQRDTAAWELAESGAPLISAFSGDFRSADQYGGLLFFSAAMPTIRF